MFYVVDMISIHTLLSSILLYQSCCIVEHARYVVVQVCIVVVHDFYIVERVCYIVEQFICLLLLFTFILLLCYNVIKFA